MSKVFGFLIALAMTTGMANAALLATWNFNSDANPSSTVTDSSATAFVNYGSTSPSGYGINGTRTGGLWQTAGINLADNLADVTKGNSFSFTNTSSVGQNKVMSIDSISFSASVPDAPPIVGESAVANSVKIRVYGSVNGGPDVLLGSPTASGSSNVTQTVTVGQTLGAGDTMTFKFVYTGRIVYLNQSTFIGSFAATSASLDNLAINGSDNVVPEPASMACFAGLFAVGALRRLRKRA